MTTTGTNIAGIYKAVFGTVQKTVPEHNVVGDMHPLKPSKRIGQKYVESISLRLGVGITQAGGANVGTAYSIEAPIDPLQVHAEIPAAEFVGSERVAYGVLSRAEQEGPAAFADAFADVMLRMKEVAAFWKEVCFLYGERPLTTIASQTGSGGTRAFVIAAANWAPGLWNSIMEGRVLDLYNAAFDTKLNTNAQIVVASIDEATRTINVTGTTADLDAAVTGTHLVLKGGFGNQFVGTDKILRTQSGSLFGISTTNSGWRASTIDIGGQINFLKAVQMSSRSYSRSGKKGERILWVPTFSWADLQNDFAALRRDAERNGGTARLGTKGIEWEGTNMELTVRHHPFLKSGECQLLDHSEICVVGSADAEFGNALQRGDKALASFHDGSTASLNFRIFSDLGMFIKKPATCVLGTGVTASQTA